MLKIAFLIFLLIFGVFKGSDPEATNEFSTIEKAEAISMWWTTTFLAYPECIDNLYMGLTMDQKKTLEDIRKIPTDCTQDDSCVKNLMQRYKPDDIDELLEMINDVKRILPKDEMWEVSRKYFYIVSFINVMFQKNNDRSYLNVTNIIDKFTEKEKKFMFDLTTKRMNYLLHYFDSGTCEQSVEFMSDNEMLHSVFEKTADIWSNVNQKNFTKIEKEEENFFHLIRNDIKDAYSSKYFRSSAFKEAPIIFKWWVSFYLNHPELSDELDTAMTKDQKFVFVQILLNYFQCSTINKEDADSCVKNYMHRFELKQSKELLKIINKVKDELPASKVRDVSSKYDVVLNFFAEVLEKLHHIKYPSLKEDVSLFTEEEKKWMIILHEEWTNYIFHYTDKDALIDFASFMNDNKILHQIHNKIILKKILR